MVKFWIHRKDEVTFPVCVWHVGRDPRGILVLTKMEKLSQNFQIFK